MSYEGITDPVAAVDEFGCAVVQFEDGKHIECDSLWAAEALAEAWRQWPFSAHPPVEESRDKWRAGFMDGAMWATRL